MTKINGIMAVILCTMQLTIFCLDDGSRTKEINEKIKNNIKHKIIFEVQGDWNMENHIQLADVKQETVGQYTGLHDKNGKRNIRGRYS